MGIIVTLHGHVIMHYQNDSRLYFLIFEYFMMGSQTTKSMNSKIVQPEMKTSFLFRLPSFIIYVLSLYI